MCPSSILVQLLDGCEDYFIHSQGEYDPATLWVKPVTWTPKSRQRELDEVRLEQGRAHSGTKKDI